MRFVIGVLFLASVSAAARAADDASLMRTVLSHFVERTDILIARVRPAFDPSDDVDSQT